MTQLNPDPNPPPLPPSSLAPTGRSGGRANVDGRRQSFGEQAARFSLYVAPVVLVLGCLTRRNRDENPDVGVVIAYINLALVVAGFVLGIVALVSMRRYGPQRILGRAIVGVLLNGLALAAFASFLIPARAAWVLKGQVAGHWRLQSASAATTNNFSQLDLTFNPDGSFKLDGARADGAKMSARGTWIITPKRLVGVDVKHVDGNGQSLVGQKLGLGRVKRVDHTALVLETDKGEETYSRLP
jgi:hypothetical protein